MSTESEFRQENNYEEDNSRQYKKKKKHKRASCDLDDKDEIPHKERRKEKHKHSSYGDEKRHGESSRHEKDSDSHRESEQKHKHKKHKHERDRDDRRRSDDQHETKQQEDTKRDSKKEIDDMFLGVNKRKEAVKDSEEAAPSAPKTESAARADMGQWGSAQFENANVQNKFFKLLGGFKKKSSGETSNVNKAAKTQLITGNLFYHHDYLVLTHYLQGIKSSIIPAFDWR